ncbi:hypothetical protein IEQ34_017647 [Dendrobium chrysotoxum]|uniref:Uncharacterized protein n=1 Tax=Dendrobium chrysotoxum TaxID=161865 RepID=A0AAV7GC05_DENCH|nr:hypothetical protein IEQ34_017647 [Dendrobium chrysotoxum]
MFMFSDRLIISLLNIKKLSNWSVFLARHIVRIKRHVIREKTYGLQTMRHVQATQVLIIVSNLQRHVYLPLEDFNNPTGFSSLQQHFERLSFDQQVLIWHITTELYFH